MLWRSNTKHWPHPPFSFPTILFYLLWNTDIMRNWWFFKTFKNRLIKDTTDKLFSFWWLSSYIIWRSTYSLVLFSLICWIGPELEMSTLRALYADLMKVVISTGHLFHVVYTEQMAGIDFCSDHSYGNLISWTVGNRRREVCRIYM